MRISGTTGLVAALLALGIVGGGAFAYRSMQETERQRLQTEAQKAKLKTRDADARAREAEAKSKEAEARKAEAARKQADAEADAKKAVLAAKKQEEANLREKSAADAAAAKRLQAEKAAADAAVAKAVAEKEAAEAERAAQAKKAEAEAVALKRAEEERRKAEADYAKTVAAKSIADAALAKSENERKTAEAAATAERDRRLRMYARANTSRAELLALQRAEKLLALEESGALERGEASEEAGMAETRPAEPTSSDDATNVAVSVAWPDAPSGETSVGEQVAEAHRKMIERTSQERVRADRRHVNAFGALIDKAMKDGRMVDAGYYRSTLIALVPDYVSIYRELIEEARKAKDEEAAGRRLDELISLIPSWQRVAVFVQLIHQDEAYYSRMLAGRIQKGEYVRTFRKIYDEARRDKGDRDERDAKVEHICKVLATYVPDYENVTEWK
ncbi:MAG: hypothetical protein Q4E45_12460 [Eubacteriales bacterium]|nr:hypothetical protein [Eubacteriales bacterium]